MGFRDHTLIPFAFLSGGFSIAVVLCRLFSRKPNRSRHAKSAVFVLLCIVFVWFAAAYLYSFSVIERLAPFSWYSWLQGGALASSISLMGIYALIILRQSITSFHSDRRQFLRIASAAVCAAPAAATAFGIVKRNKFRVKEIDIPIPNLPKDLAGLRIVQVSDIHLSAFLNEGELARAIDMANETRADLALVTGDLISRPGDPVDACLKQLARLRATAGVLGCMGNHETFVRCEDYVARQGARMGIEFLRNEARQLRFGLSIINFVGVDYQSRYEPYLTGADEFVMPGEFNILLSHNPDVFPVARKQGYQLTMAGHTHGGQVNFEILHQHLNVARYFTPYVNGLYTEAASSVFVTAGLGTIGIPVRLGVPPEIALIRLCAT